MLGIGLYGSNGHQIHHQLQDSAEAEIVAHAMLDETAREAVRTLAPGAIEHASLASLLDDPRVELVSLCSPIRAHQAEEAIACLRSGRHVYAEKPCALDERDLDRILAASRASGRVFREMSGTIYAQPYWRIREIVRSGVLGDIVQVYAQKSYPNHAGRPGDEAIDGGLLLQVGIHAVRYITQCTGLAALDVRAEETQTGLSGRGDLRSAVVVTMSLAGGALATATVNYASQRGFGHWGHEELRIWGNLGFVEATDSGTRTRLVIGENDLGPLTDLAPAPQELSVLLDRILRETPEPVAEDEEWQATRTVLRAKAGARLVTGR